MASSSNLSRRATGDVPAGVILPWAGNIAPDGWLLCDGSAISRSLYIILFMNVSTFHGSGDGSTTFNIPDGRGKFLRGVDHGSGYDPDSGSRSAFNTGGNSGDAVGSYQATGFQNHNHTLGITSNPGGTPGTYGATAGPQSFVFGYIGGANGSTGSDTRPYNLNMNWIIKF